MEGSILSSILFATVVAGTPLIIVALGQLIAEKSGVLNLGAEGMMSMGAIAGFAVTFETGNVWLGVLAGMAAGMVMSWLFAVVVLTLMGNQVATGLALSILGVGLSAFIGKPYESEILPTVGAIRIPLLADIPIIGNPLFNQQILVYVSWALFGAIVWFLYRSRSGLVLRAVGESPSSAHSIGYPVIRIRYMATLFGGAMAGIGGSAVPFRGLILSAGVALRPCSTRRRDTGNRHPQ
ncbi:MAG: ABC transporter permease [Gammaproteobacteria bacterium]|nr:ABC transporter permease [Gammaproteobacteria bacterium]